MLCGTDSIPQNIYECFSYITLDLCLGLGLWNEWNGISFKVWEANKVNGTERISWWIQTISFSSVAEFGSLHEIEANVNLVVQMKERLEAPP